MAAIKDAPGAIGTISYNGISFGVFRNNLRLSGAPVYDDADRVVTHIRYLLSLHTIIYADDVATENASMSSLQDALTQPGATLTIQDIGFDSTVITAQGGTRPDIIWGAKPRLIELQPIGGVVALEVVWECEFNVSRCLSPGSAAQFLMAFNYEMTYAIDEQGLTTRVIAGYVQVPAIRQAGGGRDLQFNVDNTWDRLTFHVPVGFRRVQNVRKINAAKNRIDFNIVDRELEGEPFPAGIIKADLQENLTARDRGFATWNYTLGGTITVAPGYPPSLGALKFFAILFQRISRIRSGLKEKESLIPLELSLGRKMFTRQSQFQAGFQLTSCMEELLQKSGIWQPVPESNYQQWKASLDQSGVFAPRGRAGLRFQNGPNELVDVCASIVGFDIPGGGRQEPHVSQANLNMICPPVTPQSSYLYYETKISVFQHQEVVHHKPAVFFKPPNFGALDALRVLAPFTVMPLAGLSEYPRGTEAVSQYQGEPETFVLLQGQALRLKWKPAAIQLDRLGGTMLEEVARVPVISQAASFFGCVAYKGKWAILYRAKGPISSMNAEDVPLLCKHE